MGNEGSIPSDTESQVSDWQSIYSYGSRAGRRSSLGSMRIPSPMEPPEPDLSHLSPDEVAKIREVIGRAKEMKDAENKRIRKLEEEYVEFTADVERRTSEVAASVGEMKKDSPLCPICLTSELIIQEGKMQEGQNVCADCGNLTCLLCGSMEQSVTSKELEWVCHMCHKRRQLVLSSGLWHPGCDVDADIPLAREVDRHIKDLEKASLARGPLTRSASVHGSGKGDGGGSSLQRQMSLPDYHMPTSFSSGHALEVIQESGFSDNMSENASPEPPSAAKALSPTEFDEMKKSAGSANSGSIRAMGQPSSRSESEYSDGISDVDMEDGSMIRSGTDGISPDDGSDDYSFMSIGSSDDNASLNIRRKHRPKSLNLSRSVSGTSSEDETSDSAISTDVESKYAGGVQPPDPHELRIALAASAFVEEMRGVDINTETDEEVADISASKETTGAEKIRFSPSAPVSPSWREGLDSPPFSPRRRDSYPGKRRGSSPVSPKDKRFTYDMSPPSRQLSLEELYDKDTHVTNNDQSFVPYPQRPSPKSPDEMKDSFISNSGDIFSFDRPPSNLKKSKPFYSLEDAAMDLNDTTTVMDLATYAATVASNTANLTSMSISPINVETNHEQVSPESRNSSSPGSPGYDNVNYPDDNSQEEESSEGDVELADPSQKSIDYQGSKRQKARPPTTDWSPVIDLSPILDVSPSLEEAEQAEMLAQQQAERERQASREDDEYAPMNTFVAIGDATAEVDYMYYGLKRYEVVEDISELATKNNGNNGYQCSPEDVSVCSNTSQNGTKIETSNTNKPLVSGANHNTVLKSEPMLCVSIAPVSVSNKTIVSQSAMSGYNNGNNGNGSVHKKSKQLEHSSTSKEPTTKLDTTIPPKIADATDSSQTKNKTRRKLPEPTADIIATQKQPVPKPRRRDRNADAAPPNPPPKPARVTRQELKEPSRNPPIYSQTALANKVAPSGSKPVSRKPAPIQKQSSEERRRTAKDMKAKPDPLIMSHLELEEASASPQYKVLESPPSPENKSIVRREYSDSTSVSPSSSPDRESFLYPSPVTPPDSDSSPPKPHSPSSGTDFEDEFILICDDSAQSNRPKEKMRNANLPSDRRHANRNNHSREVGERGATSSERDTSHHSKHKQQSPQGREAREHKQKEMKKVRRKLPPIPPEEELTKSPSPKPKQRSIAQRKPPPRTDNRTVKNKAIGSSASDDSSMNEDDKEVANITRKKQINNLDKPSIDKRNGNHIKSKTNQGKHSGKVIEANIPPDIDLKMYKTKDESSKDTYITETDAIIDSLIVIYGEPITTAMRGLKRRLQDELRRVTEGRRRKIDEIEELRVLKYQLGELKIGAANKSNSNTTGTNGKKRNTSNSRTSPQMINRRARHKRQSSDPMVSKFSPIKEDKDIESEIQIVAIDDNKGSRTADDSSQSGISDTDSIRSEPIKGDNKLHKKIKSSDYAKMFFNNYHAQSEETLDDKNKNPKTPSQLISSHSEGNLPLDTEDEETRQREEKRRELQFEIEKRRKQLAEREAKLKEARSSLGATNKHLAQSCDEISARINIPSFHPRPIPTGIIKPIDDEGDSIIDKTNFQNQANYSSTEYLAHKQEEFMKQRLEGLSSFSSPFLYSAEFGEKSAFVPQQRAIQDTYSYSTGNVSASKDNVLCSSATLPNIPISKTDIENNNRPMSDTEHSPPFMPTPAMPLLTDVKAKSRKIIHEIGTGSRPVSAEFNLGVEDLMNGMYRVESDNSVDADEPIMKHLMEGGVTILKQLERKKQPPPSAPKKYAFPVKKILLTTDPKEKYGKGRPGNGVGMKIVGGKAMPGIAEVGAYVSTIYKGGVADHLRGEVNEGDQILEWNGIVLAGKSYEDVQQIISQAPNGEVELVIRPCYISKKVLGDTSAQAPSCHSSYDNLDSDEENDNKRKTVTPVSAGVDPKQLAATLEGIEEDESPCLSHSSSQQDYNTASASSGCSSPLSEPTSTSSDQHQRTRQAVATATISMPVANQQQQHRAVKQTVNRNRYGGSQGYLQISTQQETAPIRLTPSSSDYFRRSSQGSDTSSQHTPQSNAPQPAPRKSRTTANNLEAQNNHQKEHSRSPPRIEKQNSEKYEQKKKELSNQSNSFDDYLRMSKRAGVDERQGSPSRTRASKRGISTSATELARRKGSESEDEIKKSPKGSSRGNRQMGDIQLQLTHDDNNNVLKVKVLQARNLLPMDLNGLSDPFAKLYLLPGRCADNKRRTKHIARTLHPEWKETLTFPDVHIEELRNKTLEVTVWDYDRFKANDFLGEVVIDFSEAAFLDNLPHWYPLCNHDDAKGLDIPQPTVLPPKSNRANSASPRAVSVDRHERTQGINHRTERVRPAIGRRRRSFDNLQDVDRV